jgi:hypothetical protein
VRKFDAPLLTPFIHPEKNKTTFTQNFSDIGSFENDQNFPRFRDPYKSSAIFRQVGFQLSQNPVFLSRPWESVGYWLKPRHWLSTGPRVSTKHAPSSASQAPDGRYRPDSSEHYAALAAALWDTSDWFGIQVLELTNYPRPILYVPLPTHQPHALQIPAPAPVPARPSADTSSPHLVSPDPSLSIYELVPTGRRSVRTFTRTASLWHPLPTPK